MHKNKLKSKNCVKIISTVILLIFLKSTALAQPPMEPPQGLSENETKLYSDYEIELLIDDLTEAALEAIDQAAGEAARAAILAMLEREATALREAHRWKLEAQQAKRNGIKNIIITGLACLASGFIFGLVINR